MYFRLILKKKFKLLFSLRHKSTAVSLPLSSPVRRLFVASSVNVNLKAIRYVYIRTRFLLFQKRTQYCKIPPLSYQFRKFVFLKQAVKTAEDQMKLFVLHTVLLNKLPLKYRAQTINSSLLDDCCKAKDGNVYPFHEVSEYMKPVMHERYFK